MGARSMRTTVTRCNHDYEDIGLAIGRYIFITNKTKKRTKTKRQRCAAAAGRRTKSRGEETDTKVVKGGKERKGK